MPRTQVGFPRLGSFGVFLRPALRTLGLDLVVAPPSSRRTLDLGIKHNPEMICAPCKLLFGNYVEVLEQGCQVLVMLGGPGTCRLGYSARLQETWLRQMGFDFQAHTIDLGHFTRDAIRFLRTMTGVSWAELVETVRFALALVELVDEIEQTTLRLRPLEWKQKGTRCQSNVDRLHDEVLASVEVLPDRTALGEQRDILLRRFEALPIDESYAPLRVGVVGDLYTMQESFFNMDMERELGRLGIHVKRSFWFSDSLGRMLQERVLHRGRNIQRIRAAEPYLSRDIGGFARSTVGDAALFAHEGVDGVIHLSPFSCTPEVMAHNALLTLQRECHVPILSLSFDEHTGRTGFLTRLEAFVDVLERRRQRRPGPPPQTGWHGVPSFPLSGLLESLEGRLSEGIATLLQNLRDSAQASDEGRQSDARSRPEKERS
jgi:predicted nucleotide-binding protein (sugar kinase/HSP70/actin superfamily)